jgi:1,4-dihydroxy-6-naphthoate synthase
VGLQVGRAIRESVAYALDHREAAVNYAMQFARDMDQELADKFIGMYVNKWTLGYGEKGRRAVREFLKRGAQAGLVPEAGKIDFIGADAA